MYRSLLILLLFSCCFRQVKGQELRREDFVEIDLLAKDLGAMPDLNLGTIVDSLSKKCTAEQQMTRELQLTRAFYYWLTHYITFDCKAFHHPDQNAGSASAALIQRKATSEGYARLFKAMCDLVHIDCEVVSGVYRRKLEDIGKFDPDARHYWNIVQVENTKFLVDASLGGGVTDEAVKRFKPRYTDGWWLANRLCFALTHFPDDNNLQLLEIPLTKPEVTQAPLVHAAAIVAGLIPAKSVKGLLRGRADTSVAIKFNLQRQDVVLNLNLSYDGGPLKAAEFSQDKYGFWVTLPYGPEGEHRLDLYTGDKIALSFRTDTRPAPKKPGR